MSTSDRLGDKYWLTENPGGVYGLAYKAVLGKAPDAGSVQATITWTDPIKPFPHRIRPKTIFVKCPDPSASETEKSEFLKEFENGQAINSAADHLDRTPQSEHTGQQLFKIPRMLGRGEVTLPDSEPVGCLIYDHAPGNMLNMGFPEAEVSLKDLTSADAVLRFAWWLARAVQVLHNQGVVHSFLAPRNILFSEEDGSKAPAFGFDRTFHVVGFGYARLCDARGKVPQGLKKTIDNCFRAPETRSPETYKAYWLPADIYSIGALLYYVLLRIGGQTEREARDRLNSLPEDMRRLKIMVAKDLQSGGMTGTKLTSRQESVRTIIRKNENILKIIDSCLRQDQEQRFSCVEELMDAIEIAQTAGRKPRSAAENRDQSGQLPKPTTEKMPKRMTEAVLAKHVQAIELKSKDNTGAKGGPPYFKHLRATLANDLARNFGNLQRGHLEIYGSRERIIPSLCRLLGSAQDGDLYDTVTLPDYWTDENLGSMGRFLTMNKHMVRNGVHIRRVFLVGKDKSFHKLTETEQVILEAQLAAWDEIEAERDSQDSKSPYGRFEIAVNDLVGDAAIAEFENIGSTVAYLTHAQDSEFELRRNIVPQPSPNNTVCLNFFSTARARRSKGRVLVTRTIRKVRYWLPLPEDKDPESRFNKNVQKFNEYFANAMSLKAYVRGDRDDVAVDNITVESISRMGKGTSLIKGGAANAT